MRKSEKFYRQQVCGLTVRVTANPAELEQIQNFRVVKKRMVKKVRIWTHKNREKSFLFLSVARQKYIGLLVALFREFKSGQFEEGSNVFVNNL